MRAILLSSKASEFSVNVARCMGDVGMTVVIIGVDSCKGSVLSGFCDAFYQVPMQYFESKNDLLIKLINEVAAREKCEVVIPICVPAECFLSSNREKFAPEIIIMSLSNPDIIRKLNNKWDLYCWIEELELASPRTILLENSEQDRDPDFKFPALSKPLTGTGGLGINYYCDESDYRKNPPLQYPVILQEYVPGWDIDVSLYSIEGKVRAAAIQRANVGSYTFLDNEEALDICRRILEDCKYTGLTHFDLRYDQRDGNIKCIECNPRPWGSIYASCQAGLNFPLLVWQISQYGHSAVPEAVVPQWVPNPRNIWFQDPRRAVFEWKIVYPITKHYISYLRVNFLYESYRILADHKPKLAYKWFSSVLACSKRFREKYRIIS